MNRTFMMAGLVGVVVVLLGFMVWDKRNDEVGPPVDQGNQMRGQRDASPIPKNESTKVTANQQALVDCMVESGMVVYASATCPACSSFALQLGGYEVVDELFVECTQESGRCTSEMQSNYVPEIQINGMLYQGNRDLESLAAATGCDDALIIQNEEEEE